MSGPFVKSSLPEEVQKAYDLGPLAWVLVVQKAIEADILRVDQITDIVFFLHHPERKGKPIKGNEPEAAKEWRLWREFIRPIVRHSGKTMPGGTGPLDGYVCSSFGANAKHRLDVADTQGCLPKGKDTPKKKLTESDIVFLSGHHYAGYGEPLHFDAIDMRKMKFVAPRVRLIMVSSCKALRSNALRNFKKKFPNAYIFGWVGGSPLSQSGFMKKFIASISSTIDISTEAGMKSLIEKWRNYIEKAATDKSSITPWGLGYATPKGEKTYYARKKGTWEWITR